jgi:ATP-dependent Clp protease adaptor protein ClpS
MGALYAVTLVNDDVTPLEFVIDLLVETFTLDPELAKKMTIKVHNDGTAIVASYDQKTSLAKIKEAHNRARKFGYPTTFEMIKIVE